MSRPYARSRIYPADRRRPILRSLHDQLGFQRVSGNPRAHLRSPLRAGLPARPREKEPVAICRLKRVAADNKDEVKGLMPQARFKQNGKNIALVGADRPR